MKFMKIRLLPYFYFTDEPFDCFVDVINKQPTSTVTFKERLNDSKD